MGMKSKPRKRPRMVKLSEESSRIIERLVRENRTTFQGQVDIIILSAYGKRKA